MMPKPRLLFGCLLLTLSASVGCEDEAPPPAPAAEPTPEPKAAAVAEPKKDEPNPCDNRQPVVLELPAAETIATPWGLEFLYSIGGTRVAKGDPEFIFSLHHGQAHWQTMRGPHNWNQKMTWHGFCWRGLGTPQRRAHMVKVQVAPVCDAKGRQTDFGGCGDALPD